MADNNPAFAAKPDDPKDVSWALTTADTCWKRGERSEALKWLRRAVEAASEAENDERALELAKVAADLTTQIGSVSLAPPPPLSAPPPPPAAPALPTKPTAPRAPVAPRVPAAKEAPKKADRRSATNEASRGRTPHASFPKTDETTPAMVSSPPPADPPRKKSASRADRTEAQRRPSRTDEIDAWPTDIVGGDALPPGLGAENAKVVAPVSAVVAAPIRASHAVRVVVWRLPDGSVQVAAAGASPAPSGAIEAMLVGLEPSADLVALLTAKP